MDANVAPSRRKLQWLVGAVLVVLVAVLLLPILNFPIVQIIDRPEPRLILYLSSSLETFKAQFGIYPPSGRTEEGAKDTGAENLRYYLMGPEGKGWGSPAGNKSPFGGTATGTYGPFFTPDRPGDLLDNPATIGDGFLPGKPVLYFRAEPDRDPLYDVRDNPVDPTGATGFAGQEHFERLVRPNRTYSWVRDDYLIISPGPDRLYGPVLVDEATGRLRPARPDEPNALCDDIANFNH
jgi:hypothetical protein